MEILEDAGEHRLLRFMKKYWKNEPSLTGADGDDEDLWAHEVGTMRGPRCLSINIFSSCLRLSASY